MIEVVDHGRVRELRLARPPVNALNLPLILALRAGLQTALTDGCGAVVLSGTAGRFSGGLDLPELLTLDRPTLGELWRQFFGLMKDIAAAPMPVVAALTGHSPAGGTVLAVFTDYRILAEGPYKLGLNEVQVGLPVPEVLVQALAYVVGQRQAARLATSGLLLGSQEALAVGLVDEVVPLDRVTPRAVEWATELLARPPQAMAETRRLARRPLVEAFDTLDEGAMDDILRAWFRPEAQTTLRAIAAKLGKSGKPSKSDKPA